MRNESNRMHASRFEAAALHGLDERLHAARVRWFGSRVVNGIAVSIIAAAAAALLVRVLQEFAIARVPDVWGTFARVVTVGAVVSVALAFRAIPNMQLAARLADREFDLEQVVSTAREAAADPPRSPVGLVMHDALLLDASRVISGIDPKRLAPIRIHRWYMVPIVLLTVLVVIDPLMKSDASPIDATRGEEVWQGSSDAGFDEAERDALAQDLAALAEAVDVEAEHLHDPYLASLSGALRDVSSRVRSAALAPAAASSEIDTLLRHLEDALGPRATKRLTRAPTPAAGPEDAPPVPVTSLAVPQGSSTTGASSDPTSEGIATRLDQLMAALEEAAAIRASGSDYTDAGLAAAGDRREPAAAVVEAAAAGDPAGAAQQATDAPGDAAGAGTQDLTAGDAGGSVEFRSQSDVVLPEAAGSDGGARVGAITDPEAGDQSGIMARGETDSESAAGGAAISHVAAAPGGVRDEAGAWRRDPVAPDARLLASRLFAPETAEAAW